MSDRRASHTLRVEPAGTVPPDATVRHYDELDGRAKRHLSALAADEPAEGVVDHETASGLTDGEFVKFTGYYRVVLVRSRPKL